MAMLQGKDQNFDEKWPLMRPVILKLLSQESVSKQEWQDLFWDLYSVCSWDDKEGPKHIEKNLQKIILDFVTKAQARIRAHHDGNALLRAYVVEWQKFFDQCSYLPKPFAQFEKAVSSEGVGAKKNTNGHSVVCEMMLKTWNSSIFKKIYKELKDKTMILIKQEREGEVFDAQLVIGVRQSFVNLSSDNADPLGIYREHFQQTYIEWTRDHYQLEAEAYLTEHGVRPYMKYADRKLHEEIQRAERYLESTSMAPLKQQCVEVLVSQYSKVILAECKDMIRDNESDQLGLMFSLLNRIPDGINPMLECLHEYIIQQGLADMINCANIITTDSEKYIELLLNLYNHYTDMVRKSFQNHHSFLTARDKAFEKVVNDHSVFNLELQTKAKNPVKLPPESRCPELLANFCDMLLRKTSLSKKLSSEDIDLKLKNVLLLLKYVSNKDVFMRYHKAHLTRRLILGSSADNEKEENMVEGLREVGMPADYVNKLARMFQDIKVSEDLNQQFKEMRSDKIADNASIKILNAGAWSRRTDKIPISLPSELEDLIPDVETFYKQNHTGRKLNWNHLMSHGVLTFKTDVGQYDLEVTTFQMSCLYVWNSRPKEAISFESLRLATQLPDPELRKTLWSLVSNSKLKRQVLLFEPKVSSPKEFVNGTKFSINHRFGLWKGGNPVKRGRVNLIGRLQLATEKAREEDNDGITQLRIFRTQEAIVKIMKMRKRIGNAQLQTELVEMLKNMFLPQKKLIKQQIEWLIDHGFMIRDESDINTFIYVT